MITSRQDLRDLYAKHCVCRPLDVQRPDEEHDPICDLGILADIRAALFGESVEIRFAAVKRCDRYQRDDYTACRENTH